MNKVRDRMTNKTLTAQILLTTNGEPWVAMGYTVNNVSSGKLPMPNDTQWSHSVERYERTILTFFWRQQNPRSASMGARRLCTINWVASG